MPLDPTAIQAAKEALEQHERATEGPWRTETLVGDFCNVGIRARGERVSGYVAAVNTRWAHAEQQVEQRANADWIADARDREHRIASALLAADAEIERLRAALDQLRDPPCGVCAGTGDPGNGRKCICDGKGTRSAEMHGLRGAVIEMSALTKLIRSAGAGYAATPEGGDGRER